MKKRLIIFIYLVASSICYSQTGNNLVFNKVIDTIISVEVNGCINIVDNPQNSADFIVPDGKVWKITSVSEIIVEGFSWASCNADNYRYFDVSLLKYSGTSWGQEFILANNSTQGSAHYIYNMDSFPIWMAEGSKLKLKLEGNQSDRALSNDAKGKVYLSLIEFNVSQ
tara:strand:+ start:1188 stop:1691 length:504 start_codon:yes stop_codon:yes gene_type:complete